MNDTNCCRVDVDKALIEEAKRYLDLKEARFNEEVKVFALLGNAVRLKIMTLFLEFERMCVCDLGDVLEMNQSPISQHLRKLKDGGLLLNKREGMTIFYSINPAKRAMLEQVLKEK